MMETLLYNLSTIVTVDTSGKNFKQGKELSHIVCLYDHSIVVEDDLIKDILPTSSLDKNKFEKIIDVSGKTVLPGLVECHTHTPYAGSRANEFRMKLKGKTYEQIAQSGGGILTTVSAVREITLNQLIQILIPRVKDFISQGITTLEIKSGYGLDAANELKLLVNQVESQLIMRHYDGFMKKTRIRGRRG